jgi:hypothetical protein
MAGGDDTSDHASGHLMTIFPYFEDKYFGTETVIPRLDQACQIVIFTTYQNGKNIPKRPQNIPKCP